MKKQFLTLLFFLVFFCNPVIIANAEGININPKEEILEAIVTKVIEEKQINIIQKQQLFQKLELKFTKGTMMGQKIIIENGNISLANQQKYQINDRVMVTVIKGIDGKINYYISDYIRRNSLLMLFIIFTFLTIIIGRIRGLLSLIGMGTSFLVIFYFILPQILLGNDPVITAIMGSFIIIPISFFLSHGLNKKTVVAIGGTLIALVITGILAVIFVKTAHLTGFFSEEASFLQIAKQGLIDMKGLLLAGIIIGVLGVLDDITISQSAIVFQLKEANNRLNTNELFTRAMNVGQDHISSMVNTLILVYTGAALPLLLLFINNPHPLSEIINYEIIANEVVRTLVGSIGLILSVPITTFLAAFAAKNHR